MPPHGGRLHADLGVAPFRLLCPSFVIEQFKAGRRAGSMHAAAIDVDISGFSKISDALSSARHEGSELLAKIIRSVFEPLTSSVYEYEGFIAHYSGDGFLALFPVDEDRRRAVERAASAAWQMRQSIRSRHTYRTPFGLFEFNARLGVAEGDVHWRIFSDPGDTRSTFYFGGQRYRLPQPFASVRERASWLSPRQSLKARPSWDFVRGRSTVSKAC